MQIFFMAKTKQAKEAIIKNLTDKLKPAKSAVIANQDGLSVADVQELRRRCQAQSVDLVSVKKTLLEKALQLAGLEGVDVKSMAGSLAVAVSRDDEVAPAKILKEFSKSHEQVNFRAGIYNGAIISVDEVKKMADLLSRPELYAKIVGSISAPLSGLVNVLSGNLRGLINVLNAIKNSK